MNTNDVLEYFKEDSTSVYMYSVGIGKQMVGATYDYVARICGNAKSYSDAVDYTMINMGIKMHSLFLLCNMFSTSRSSEVPNYFGDFSRFSEQKIADKLDVKQIIGGYSKYCQQFNNDRLQDYIMYETSKNGLTYYYMHSAVVYMRDKSKNEYLNELNNIQPKLKFECALDMVQNFRKDADNIVRQHLLVSDFVDNYDFRRDANVWAP